MRNRLIKKIFCAFFIGALQSSILYASDSGPVGVLPEDVQKIMARKASCGQWAGEDGYDLERKKEIEAALNEAKCDRFDADLKLIMKKYRMKKAILKAIEEASADS